METTFYHDESLQDRDQMKQLKRTMTLDFNSGISSKRQKLSHLLQSPDLNMLKLGSPELEKMIIAANGMVTTTPTPTQFVFPKHVTEEQEAYARGFVDALAELQKGEDMEESINMTKETVKVGTNSAPITSFYNPVTESLNLTTTTSLPGGLVNPTPSRPTTQAKVNTVRSLPQTIPTTATTTLPNFRLNNVNSRINMIKDEPQTVPCMMGNSPPLSPINMETQEVIKLERKRARNRVAARKCRTRKLERISRLEDRVSDLKGDNADLLGTATTLRDQVCKLKQQIIEHVNSGCQVMMANNINFS